MMATKKTRRSNHEGTAPRQRADGRWMVEFGWTTPDGRRRRTSVYGRTRAAVVEKAKTTRRRLEEGRPAADARLLLADYVERWIETTLAASDRKESTKRWYATMARGHVAGSSLGKLSLSRVTPSKVEGWRLELRKGGGLSESSVRSAFTTLRQVLATARRDGLVATNAADEVARPSVTHQEPRHLSVAEVNELLEAAEGSRFAPLFRLLVATGLRRGEALGLRWADIDLDARTLRVRRTLSRVDGALVTTEPKSAMSKRTIALNGVAVEVLRERRQAQREERVRAGSKWTQTGYVFTTESGKPVEPRNALRALTTAASAAGLENADEVELHTLRHTAATLMLTNGVPLTTVSRVLGHGSIAVTSDLYGHVSPEVSQAAADILGAALEA